MERGSLELKIPRENPGAGEEVQVIANATGYGDGKIILRVGNEENEFECVSPCEVSRKFIVQSGAYSVKAILVLRDGRRVEQSGRIIVSGNTKACIGGIAFG